MNAHAMPERAEAVFVTDYDGTMTESDFFEEVRTRLAGDDDPWQEYLRGEITHFEALRRIFARVRDEATARELARATRLDPETPAAVPRLRKSGWEVVVASAGCRWYIDLLFGEAGIDVPVVANPGSFVPQEGLVMTLPAGSPFFSPETGIDKTALLRYWVARCDRVAFAGDGRPDLAPALLVPGRLRFARGWLAEALAERGEPFRPFGRWSEIAAALTAEPVPSRRDAR